LQLLTIKQARTYATCQELVEVKRVIFNVLRNDD
jgi:hypothetical protein